MCGWYNIKIFVENSALFYYEKSKVYSKETRKAGRIWTLDVPEEHFYTSALATAAFLKEQAAGCSAFVIGEAGLLNALYDVGITMEE